MTKRRPTNIAASVRQRLQNVARTTGRPFQEVLQYYAIERFLYRLTQSPLAERFVLKGALMFRAWGAPPSRPTKDIDLLGNMENNSDTLAAAMREVCCQNVEADGLVFDPESVAGMVITEAADYAGVRVTFRGSLQNARISMQIDIGFGDVVFPDPEMTEYPTILNQAALKLRGYTRETAIAEKFEAMVKLGLLNSRMKDFYDIWLLSRQFNFDGATLASAIARTFANRGTTVSPQPTAFKPVFATDASKTVQWQAFLRKSGVQDASHDLALVVDAISAFLSPPAASIGEGSTFTKFWIAPGPWSEWQE